LLVIGMYHRGSGLWITANVTPNLLSRLLFG
jgi:hypothetical protein